MLRKNTGIDPDSSGAPAASLTISGSAGRPRDDWALVVDAAVREIAVTVCGHVTSAAAFEMATQVATILRQQGLSIVKLDLLDVESLDIDAPIQAIRPIAPLVQAVERVDVIVRNWRVQLAALSALSVLGVPFQIHRTRKRG